MAAPKDLDRADLAATADEAGELIARAAGGAGRKLVNPPGLRPRPVLEIESRLATPRPK